MFSTAIHLIHRTRISFGVKSSVFGMKPPSSGTRLRARNSAAKQRRDWLVDSLRAHLLPAFTNHGFVVAPLKELDEPIDRDYLLCFPQWGRLLRYRDSVVDLVEIQLASQGRAGFRINSGVAARDGLTTWAGHRSPEQMGVHFLEEWFESDARPWLTQLNLLPFGTWFSVWRWPWRPPNRNDYEAVVLRAAGIVTEIDVALREGKLGPHIRKVVFPWSSRPRPRDIKT